MLSEKQKNEVLKLISYKQEGAYWDFKSNGMKMESRQIYYMILSVWRII